MSLHDPRLPDGLKQLGHLIHALIEDRQAFGFDLFRRYFHELGNAARTQHSAENTVMEIAVLFQLQVPGGKRVSAQAST